jgi:hypothetical protein
LHWHAPSKVVWPSVAPVFASALSVLVHNVQLDAPDIPAVAEYVPAGHGLH